VTAPDGGLRTDPSVAGLRNGGFVVTWQSFGQDGSGWGVFARQFDADSAAVSPEVQVNTGTVSAQRSPHVTALADGSYIVAWYSDEADGAGGIFAQRFTEAGVRNGGEIRLSDSAFGAKSNPAIAALGDGGFVAVWDSGSGNTNVQARIFDAQNSAVAASFTVNTATAGAQSNPVVAATDGGGFLVVWQASTAAGGPTDIRAQAFSLVGDRIGAEETVNSHTSNIQAAPAIAQLGNGDVAVTWESNLQDGDGLGIYSTLLRPNAQPSGHVAITGETIQGGALFADVSELSAPDRAGNWSYQWLREGQIIAEATDLSYEPTLADVGTTISLRISYTDTDGIVETVTSDLTDEIIEANDSTVGDLVIMGQPQVGEELVAGIGNLSDANGIAQVRYQWFVEGVGASVGTGIRLELEPYHLGRTISLKAVVTDGLGNVTEFKESTAELVGRPDRIGLPEGEAIPIMDADQPLLSKRLFSNGSTVAIYGGNEASEGRPQTVRVMADGSITPRTTLLADVEDLDRVLNASVLEDGRLQVLFEAGGAWRVQTFDLAGNTIPEMTAAMGAIDDARFETLRTTMLTERDFLFYTENNITFYQQLEQNNKNAAIILRLDESGLFAKSEIFDLSLEQFTNFDGFFHYRYSFSARPLTSDLFYFVQDNYLHLFKDSPRQSFTAFVHDLSGERVQEITDFKIFLETDQGILYEQSLSAFPGRNITLGLLDYNGDLIVDAKPYISQGEYDARRDAKPRNDEIKILNDGQNVYYSLYGSGAQKYVLNQKPTGDLQILNIVEEGSTLLAISSDIADADGLGTLNYAWLRDFVLIASATSDTYTLTEADLGAVILSMVTYTDGNGTTEFVVSDPTGLVMPQNYLPTGMVGISRADQSDVLSVDADAVADQDGLGNFSFAWLRNGEAIEGAAEQTYRLRAEDMGAPITAALSWIDGRGNAEQLVSVSLATFSGSAGPDRLTGTPGRDVIFGRGGSDIIIGGFGNDRLIGGPGDDFLFGNSPDAVEYPEASAQIYRLYQVVLDRVPDSGGYLSWTTQIAVEGVDPLQVVRGFVNAREFQMRFGGLDDEGFVTLLYQNALGRNPDAQGLVRWINHLGNGVERAVVVQGFSDSRELRNKTDAEAATFAQNNSASVWADDIFRLYQATLDRAPDIIGFKGWTDRLETGTPFLDVVEGFVRSREFQTTNGSLDDSDFVTLLYQNVLERVPDAPGLAGWTNALTTGSSRAEVVRGFSQSTEFIAASAEPLASWVFEQGPEAVRVSGEGNGAFARGWLSDTFVFSPNGGSDRVMDLESWDSIDLRDFGYTSDSEARASMNQQGNDVIFADKGSAVTFLNTVLGQIGDDMIWV